jgi:hypothetical protein
MDQAARIRKDTAMPNSTITSYRSDDQISEQTENTKANFAIQNSESTANSQNFYDHRSSEELDFLVENESSEIIDVAIDKPTIFDGWQMVPANYKTREGWELLFRTVKTKEKPVAMVRTSRKHELQCVEQEFEVERFNKLFSFSQTREVRKTSLKVARLDFYDCFVANADWQRHIKWTKGEFIGDGAARRWDSGIDAWGWRTHKRKLSLTDSIDHQQGKEIYGIFGGKRSHFLLIDLDLHNQPLELFLKRLDLLLDRFHGRHRCHFQVADSNARGVHIILFFGTAGLLRNRHKWLLRVLSKIDEADPSGQFTKIVNGVLKFNIEVFPNTQPVRLPLARNRKMLLDKPVNDVTDYMQWLRQDPAKRTFMSKDEVRQYIIGRLDHSCADTKVQSEIQPSKPEAEVVPEKIADTPKSLVCKSDRISLKGKTRPAIVGFWMHGEGYHFQHLNAAILITLSAIHAEGLSEDEAIEVMMQYVADIPNKGISSRLSGDLGLVNKEVARQVAKIWSIPVSKKWQRSVECWRSYGFRVSSKTTWSAKPRPTSEEVVVDCEQIVFNDSERDLIIRHVAPPLVGKLQANKKEKQDEVEKAVAYFLRYVRCCSREIPYKDVAKILSCFRINFGNDHKRSKFLKLLTESEWIYVKTKYFCPLIHGGTSGTGRATAYGIGPKMAQKFSLPLPPPTNPRDLFLSSTFRKGRNVDGEVDKILNGNCDNRDFETSIDVSKGQI